MVNTARAEAHLRDFKAATFTKQHVFFGHADVLERDVHVTVRSMVFAENVHGAFNRDAGGVFGHQNHRLLLVRGGVRAGANHRDEDLATRAPGA